MSILTYPLGFIGGGKEDFYNGVIENSLKSGATTATDYLDRDKPSSADNVTTWTISWWMKVASIPSPSGQWIFGTMPGTNHTDFLLNTSNKLYYEGNNAGLSPSSPSLSGYSTMEFKDADAWYHCVFVWDSNNAKAADRSRLYVNGRRDTITGGTSGSDALGAKFYLFAGHGSGTDSAKFRVGGYYYTGSQQTYHFHGHLTDIYGIDGYALGPENFGEFKNGVWIPKAYAGPPPLLTDSSPDPKGLDLYGANAGKITYEQNYIGESAIDAKQYSPAIRINDRSKFSIGANEDFTIDCWLYDLANATDHNYRFLQGGANQSDGISIIYGDASSHTLIYLDLTDATGGTTKIQMSRTLIGYDTKWHHLSFARGGGKLRLFADGVLANTVSDTTAFYQDPTNDNLTLFGYPGSGVDNTRTNGIVDEFRWIVGESQPPRFYFGTNYGDQDGGVLPQRATSDHRFTDDERTVVLVSGQNANNHARSILIDESGHHIDNVRWSNTTLSPRAYPHQDGVGSLFAISGPQHSTKDSFIGNTSSLLFDGKGGGLRVMNSNTSIDLDTGDWTIDFWAKRSNTTDTVKFLQKAQNMDDGGEAYSWFIVSNGIGNTRWGTYQQGGSSAVHDTATNQSPHVWEHYSIVRKNDVRKLYFNGLEKSSVSDTIHLRDAPEVDVIVGRAQSSEFFQGFMDEVRIIVGDTDKPQIKWTHTQTAGAGNKDAYDVHGWRAHGHEFTDDNATKLLIHGDLSESANTTNLTAKGYQFDGTNDNIDLGDLHGAVNYGTWAGWFYITAPTEDAGLFSKRSSTEQTGDYFVRLNADATLEFDAWTGSGWHAGGASNTPFTVPIGRVFHFAFQYSSDGTALTKWWLDGELKHTDSTTIGGDAVTLNGGTSDFRICGTDGQNPGVFKGACLGFTFWNHASQANMVALDINGIYALGPTGNILTSYSSEIAGWWGMGNQDSLATGNSGGSPAAADTSSTVYDRSSISSVTNGTFNGAAAPVVLNTITNALLDTGVSTFKDSSSANSIHHALVSGHGAHHTKAVTMSSDGTNGTSTTDALGNTIYWCGSNSTVTYANSSSFSGYGNTAIKPNNGYNGTHQSIQIADHVDFDVADDADFSWFCWVYINQSRGSQYQAILDARVSDSWTGIGHLAVDPTLDLRMHSSRSSIGGGTDQRLTAGSWHHVGFTRDGSTGYLFRDGVIVANGTDDGTITTTTPFRVGEAQHSSSSGSVIEDLDGYVTEVMYTKSYMPPRFYLGNQTPVSGGSLTEFKYADFDGSADYYSKSVDDWQVGDTQGTIVVWFKPDSSHSGTLFASSKNGTDNFFHMQIAADYKYKFQTDISGTSYVARTSPSRTYSVGKWNCFVIQSTGTAYRMWHNGKPMTSSTAGTAAQGSWLNTTTDRQNIAIGTLLRSSAGHLFNGKISQVAYWGGSSGDDGVLTAAQIEAIYDLGPTADLTSSYNTDLDGYWSFTKTTQGTSTTTTLYDQSSGSDDDMTGTSMSTITTAYHVGSNKRLAQCPEEYSTSSTSTEGFGNNHFANVVAESVTAGNFGGFVDDEYTVLLLRGGYGDGNTTFTDSGVAGGKTITFPSHSHSYGKTRIAKTLVVSHGSPVHEVDYQLGLHGSSLDFDGTDSIQVLESGTLGNDFWFEEEDFCVEGWFRLDSTDTCYGFGISDSSETASQGALRFSISGSGTDAYMLVRGANDTAISTGNVPNFAINTWHHIAIQRYKKLIMLFVNGVANKAVDITDTAAWGNSHQKSNAKFAIGSWGEKTNNRWQGQIDELRVTKGIARYTPDGASQSGIVPGTSTGAGSLGTSIPTSAYLRPTPFLAADGGRGYFANTNVKLWIKSDSYPGDTTFVDYCGALGQHAKTISNAGHTAANRPTIQTGDTEYALSGGTDAMYFDGTNDIIVVPQHKDLRISDNFTVECWFRQTYSGTNDQTIWSFASGTDRAVSVGSDNEYFKLFTYQSGHVRVSIWKSGTIASTLIGTTVTINAWHHVAVQRENGLFRLFLDGVENDGNPSFGTGFESLGTENIWQSDMYIGAGKDNNGFVSAHYFQGYIDEFRWSHMARYTDKGILDSAELRPLTEFGIQTEGTTYGRWDTQVTANTTYQRYNYQHTHFKHTEFDGTNDYARKASITNYLQGHDRGTVNAWILNDDVDSRCIFGVNNVGGTNQYAYLYTDGSKRFVTYDRGAHRKSKTLVQLNDWTMVSYVHDGTDVKLYINGTYSEFDSTSGTVEWFGQISSLDDVFIGRVEYNTGPSVGDFFDGKIAQVGVWSSSSGTTGVLTQAQLTAIYELGPGGDLTTSYGTGLVDYWTFGNKSTEGTDTASTIYSQVSGSSNDLTGTSLAAPVSATKLLIHSNSDLDGDAKIVDSSPSDYKLVRIAGAMTTTSTMSDPFYTTRPAALTGLPNQTANTCIYGRNIATDYLALPDDKSFKVGTGQFTIVGWQYTATEQGAYQDLFNKGGGFQFGRQTGTDKMAWFGGTADEATSSTTAEDAWHHVAVTRNTSQVDIYVNGSDDATESGTGWNADLDYDGTHIKINYGTSSTAEVYVDQVAFYTGVALSSTHIGHIRGGGNGNTKFGTLGGMILHEEYTDGTNTANAATAILLHSNNATHHTKGSRLFYNDVGNTKFTTTTGHEAAGRFTIGASSGIFTVLGAHQTGYGSAMNNPSIRLRRGYTYIFSASSLSSHKFYFANSTSDYAASTTLANQYIGGQYGTNSTVDGTETWTAFSAGHFLGGNGTSGQWNHMKFEVPTDAPKDLYYRCAVSGHGAMGNAAFIMEATEPAPVKAGTLPALKTSTWNDRNFTGIGTNNSVIAFNRLYESYLETGSDATNWRMDGDATIEYWIYPTNGAAVDYEGVFGLNASGTNINLERFETAYHNNNYSLYHDTGSWIDTGVDKVLNTWEHHVWAVDGGTGVKLYIDGVQRYNNTDTRTFGGGRIQLGKMSTYFHGFMDEIAMYKGIEFNANTVIERYQAGRAGNHLIANSACVLHIKSDSTYGETVFTDSSRFGTTITNYGGVYHHINDNRTANTALYFDGANTTYLKGMSDSTSRIGKSDFTWEAWVKTKEYKSNQVFFAHWQDGTNNMRFGLAPRLWCEAKVGGTGLEMQAHSGEKFADYVWNHVSLNRHGGRFYITCNGIVVVNSTTNPSLDYTSYVNAEAEELSIGIAYGALGTYPYPFSGWMDGIRVTLGFARYTSGIPEDGQSPHKGYDDGRSSNTANSNWTSSSTRQYYGINTHTYLQTSQYATNANTVLMLRGDDAVTANDGVNMYGDNGFHLEFKEVGAGEERDYNNLRTGVRGLGSDTSATEEFGDSNTNLLVRSRSNQGNNAVIFVDETAQDIGTITGTAHHSTSVAAVFGVDSNTANVSIASGGTRNY